MNIAHSRVAMDMQHQYSEKRIRQVDAQASTAISADNGPEATVAAPRIEAPIQYNEAMSQEELEENLSKDPNLQVLRYIISAITGKGDRVHYGASALTLQGSKLSHIEPNQQNKAPDAQTENNTAIENFRQIEHYSESENLEVNIKGKLHTACGEMIEFDHKLTMSRQFERIDQLDINGNIITKDPLVVNYASDETKLSHHKVAFDLDGDNSVEMISTPVEGSGFLAIDKNGNNQIDNGTELFGALTGDGFEELAQYDFDQNGYIDEADPLFKNLTIMVHNPDGSHTLTPLNEVGIHAISIQSISSPFTITNDNNDPLAIVKETGFAISEDGDVKTVQQLDLVV
jgi:hypothetical protein